MRVQHRTVLVKLLFVSVFIAISLLSSCADSNVTTTEEENRSSDSAGWDFFEEFNPIGIEYAELSEHHSLVEDSTVDGGVALQVDGKEMYYGFPALSQDEIADSDECTAVYGTLNSMFGINEECSVEELSDMLHITFKEDYDESLIGTTSVNSGSYYVQIYTPDIEDVLKPETGMAVFHKDDDRVGADSIPEEEIYVDLHAVDSSVISAIGYDDDYQILAIEFLDSQDLWYYYDVPVEVYNDLENAESIGTYYNQNIKGVYASNKQN